MSTDNPGHKKQGCIQQMGAGCIQQMGAAEEGGRNRGDLASGCLRTEAPWPSIKQRECVCVFVCVYQNSKLDLREMQHRAYLYS